MECGGWHVAGREGLLLLSLIRGRSSEAWHPVLSVVPLLPAPPCASPIRLTHTAAESWGWAVL